MTLALREARESGAWSTAHAREELRTLARVTWTTGDRKVCVKVAAWSGDLHSFVR